MKHNIYIYIAIMAAVTFVIRVLPLTLIRGKIKNKFLRSFLYYVPYVTLSVMTFPAIIEATQTPLSGIFALAVGGVCAYKGAGLFKVAVACCVTVLALEFLLSR